MTGMVTGLMIEGALFLTVYFVGKGEGASGLKS